MSVAWTSFKIGLLTIVSVGAVVVIAFALGVSRGPKETIAFRTYFDESVVGLELGAPVKYRGITIGSVDRIAVAPDGRFVEVTSKVDAAEASRLAWSAAEDTGLRAQVSSTGLTGTKLIDMEYVDPAKHPPPTLPFPPPEHYIPSSPSFFLDLQGTLTDVSDALQGTLHRLDGLVDDIDANGVPERVVAALASINSAAADLRTALRDVNEDRIPDRTASAIASFETTLASMNRFLANAEHATESVDVLGTRAAGLTDELDRTVRDLGDAARAVRTLTDSLERDPDMLLKGRRSKTERGGKQ